MPANPSRPAKSAIIKNVIVHVSITFLSPIGFSWNHVCGGSHNPITHEACRRRIICNSFADQAKWSQAKPTAHAGCKSASRSLAPCMSHQAAKPEPARPHESQAFSARRLWSSARFGAHELRFAMQASLSNGRVPRIFINFLWHVACMAA